MVDLVDFVQDIQYRKDPIFNSTISKFIVESIDV